MDRRRRAKSASDVGWGGAVATATDMTPAAAKSATGGSTNSSSSCHHSPFTPHPALLCGGGGGDHLADCLLLRAESPPESVDSKTSSSSAHAALGGNGGVMPGYIDGGAPRGGAVRRLSFDGAAAPAGAGDAPLNNRGDEASDRNAGNKEAMLLDYFLDYHWHRALP